MSVRNGFAKPLLVLGLLLVVGVIATAWWMSRGQTVERSDQRDHGGDATLPIAALADSHRAAASARRWAQAVEWAALLAEREPNDPARMFELGMAWHNLAWGGSGSGAVPSATRTSLDRVRIEKHALAILDSAAALARTPEESAHILHWIGQIHEINGLPIEAAIAYQEALALTPQAQQSLARATWVMKRLRDPLGNQ